MYVIKHKVQIIPSLKIINRINIWEVHRQHKTRRKNFIDNPRYRLSGLRAVFQQWSGNYRYSTICQENPG